MSIVQLPTDLRFQLEKARAGVAQSALQAAAERLSHEYRQSVSTRFSSQLSELDVLAYGVTRMPATYASLCKVFDELQSCWDVSTLREMLDLGAGTGAALWAANEILSLDSARLLEHSTEMFKVGQRLAGQAESAFIRSGEWLQANLATIEQLPAADLVCCAYALNELTETVRQQVLAKAWQAARQIFVIVEPGTPQGFALLRQARSQLLTLGGTLLVPCPHAHECPLTGEDWCHFAARVERTALHRQLKGGTLGFEDEKFSYLIFAREPVAPRAASAARILRHPRHEPGRISLQLCTSTGLQQRKVTKRDAANWRAARKAGWGDLWQENDETA